MCITSVVAVSWRFFLFSLFVSCPSCCCCCCHHCCLWLLVLLFSICASRGRCCGCGCFCCCCCCCRCCCCCSCPSSCACYCPGFSCCEGSCYCCSCSLFFAHSGFLHVAHGDCYPCMLLGFVMLLVAAVVLAFILVVASFCFVLAAVALGSLEPIQKAFGMKLCPLHAASSKALQPILFVCTACPCRGPLAGSPQHGEERIFSSSLRFQLRELLLLLPCFPCRLSRQPDSCEVSSFAN